MKILKKTALFLTLVILISNLSFAAYTPQNPGHPIGQLDCKDLNGNAVLCDANANGIIDLADLAVNANKLYQLDASATTPVVQYSSTEFYKPGAGFSTSDYYLLFNENEGSGSASWKKPRVGYADEAGIAHGLTSSGGDIQLNNVMLKTDYDKINPGDGIVDAANVAYACNGGNDCNVKALTLGTITNNNMYPINLFMGGTDNSAFLGIDAPSGIFYIYREGTTGNFNELKLGTEKFSFATLKQIGGDSSFAPGEGTALAAYGIWQDTNPTDGKFNCVLVQGGGTKCETIIGNKLIVNYKNQFDRGVIFGGDESNTDAINSNQVKIVKGTVVAGTGLCLGDNNCISSFNSLSGWTFDGVSTVTTQYNVGIGGGNLILNNPSDNRLSFTSLVNAGGSIKGLTTHQIFGPYNSASGDIGALYIGAGISSDNTRNDIILYNLGCNGGNCNVPKIELNADTTKVTGNLDVAGTITSNGNPITGGSGSQWTTSGNDIYYNNGNVGIGTTSSTEKLNIAGSITFVDPTTNQPYLNNWIGVTNNVPGDVGHNYLHLGGVTDNDNIRRIALFADKTYISGNVGIGTSTPGATLDVNGNVNVAGKLGIGTSSPGAILDVEQDLGSYAKFSKKDGSSGPVIQIGNDGCLSDVGIANGFGVTSCSYPTSLGTLQAIITNIRRFYNTNGNLQQDNAEIAYAWNNPGVTGSSYPTLKQGDEYLTVPVGGIFYKIKAGYADSAYEASRANYAPTNPHTHHVTPKGQNCQWYGPGRTDAGKISSFSNFNCMDAFGDGVLVGIDAGGGDRIYNVLCCDLSTFTTTQP